MATYNPLSLVPATAAENPPEVLCDTDSDFSDGFPLALNGKPRAWTPLWGGPCSSCGTPT